MKYQLAIFDLDGTLLDTLDDLADSVNFALESKGYPQRSREEVRRFVGNGIRKLVERAVPAQTDCSDVDEVFACFVSRYKEHCADKTKPYDGVLELLRQLKEYGVKTAVVSNKADDAVKALCNQYFPGLLCEAIGERAGIARKPAPDTVQEVLRLLGTDKAQAVYIGDSEVDVETAKNADMDCIAVDWGFRDADVLRGAGAETMVSDIKQLKDVLLW